MARFEMAHIDMSNAGQGPSAADTYYELGIRYSVGAMVEADLIAAHKWFNLAAMKGSKEAVQLRQEIAANMSPADIAAAQRAARDWLTRH
jgi:TPR repeat protein